MTKKTVEKEDEIKSRESATQKQVVVAKHSLYWNYVFLLLQNLEWNKEIMEDKGFRTIYEKMLKYVSSKIPLPSNGEILDWYVVIEQEQV